MVSTFIRLFLVAGIVFPFTGCKSKTANSDVLEASIDRQGEFEHRCGWIDNPTPGNWFLTDSAGGWTISTQGAGDYPPGMDSIPDFGQKWIRTNGYYGYGCGCFEMRGESKNGRRKVTEIQSAKVQDISICQNDKNLSQRDPMDGVETQLCGWIDNPTPGNWWLTDKFGNWTISAQGGHRALGESMPDFGTKWVSVRQESSYGYGCACINAHVSKSNWLVNRVDKVTVQDLNVCRTDRNIPSRVISKKKLDFCGWFVNDTPANWSLYDKFGRWDIAVQGGYQSLGSEYLEHTPQWVKVNGNYGYGCACLNAEVDDSFANNRKVYRINSVTPQGLDVCKTDKSLPKLEFLQ